MKAETAVRAILQEILVQSSEQKIQGVDADVAILYMNITMSELAVTIPLGYTEVSSLADEITVPDGAIGGLIANTATRLLSQYDIIPNGQLARSAESGLNAMRILARKPIRTTRPSTLPIGSGNENTLNDRRFFPEKEESILDEQFNTILIESDTDA